MGVVSPEQIERNLGQVRARIAAACARAGRDPSSVVLVAVTKAVGPEEIRLLAEGGVQHIGENRVQAAQRKRGAVSVPVTWHMIGPLQTNKAARAVELFDVVHSLDRAKLAGALSSRLDAAGRDLDVYIEVSVAGERQKSGMAPQEVPAFIEEIRARHPRLRPIGLMTMPPQVDDPEDSRPLFVRLRELAGRVGLPGLSMGMTQDFAVAVEEGATVVRIGRALFEAPGVQSPESTTEGVVG